MRKVGPNNPFGVTDGRVKPATEAQVAKLERRLGAKLPKDYRRFLMIINGGRRPGGGWRLPKYELAIDTFYGLRRDFYNLVDAVDCHLQLREEGDANAPPDTIPIGYEVGNKQFLMKYRGRDTGSIWFWPEMNETWRKIAPSFDAFTAMLHQEPELVGIAALRGILERDDVVAARRYVESQPPGKLDEPDECTGHSLLQRAADAGAANVVSFLLDGGARNMAGLGGVNVKRHAKVIELLLTRGRYRPTAYDWQGAAAFGGLAVLRVYFEHATPPPPKMLKKLVQNSKNLMKSKPSKEREQVIRMLEDRLAASAGTPGFVRRVYTRRTRRPKL